MTTPAAYLTWDPKNPEKRALAMAQIAEMPGLIRTQGNALYSNVAPNVSIRNPYQRSDYEQFRPEERLPTRPKEIIAACNKLYQENGIVRNTIDMMADFTSKGVDVVHADPNLEPFYRDLFHQRWKAQQVTERFANYLYRHATVICKRQTGAISFADGTSANEIPLGYSFINPTSVELVSEELATLVGPEAFLYSVQIPQALISRIKSNRKDDQLFLKKLPEDITLAIRQGAKSIPIDPKKIVVSWYKRDDWEAWGRPILASLLADFQMLQKMKLADLSALDGVITAIRVWKLGDLDKGIMPHPNTMSKFASMLVNNVGGGIIDVVWGPDVNLVETSTNVHQFLGSTKYAPVLRDIYSGLGIPQTLTASETTTGFTNNYISLKTLTERLQYGRDVIQAFWESELRLVQIQLRHSEPARVKWDNMLTDDASAKQLLVNLADRNLIDQNTLIEEVGFDPAVIRSRLGRDAKDREQGKLPPKASPFHYANLETDLVKMFAGTGAYAPSEFGLDIEPDIAPAELVTTEKGGDSPPAEIPKGQPGEGRPPNSTDTAPRDQRTPKPRTSAEFLASLRQAEENLDAISRKVTPVYLQSLGKASQRELTNEESEAFEAFKFAMLCNHRFGEPVTHETVRASLLMPLVLPELAASLLRETVATHQKQYGQPPTLPALRSYHAAIAALVLG